MLNKIKFQPISEFNPGTICNILNQSYVGSPYENEKHIWADFDNESYNNPQTVGRCVFISIMSNKIIGLTSYDPRQKPLGIIGHNCILPKYRRNGYGKEQILEIIRILKMKGFIELKVTTDEHPFFIPAQKMYLSCGFKEVSRRQNNELSEYKYIEYRQEI
ncbi:MAG: GNAT family N-acetyltransferase [Promethearchaeota archaeon]